MNHEQFQDLLDELVGQSGVGQEVLGDVLARTSLRAPQETSRVEIATGNPSARRPVDQRAIPQGTVSKAVKALKDKGLLEDGEKLLWSPDGRTLSPLRLGSRYAMAGAKVVQAGQRPQHVTTALFGLDSSRVLRTAHDAADSWDQAANLIRQHVTSLKNASDQDRASRGLPPLRMLGVGVEVGAPVHNGQVMPLPRDQSGHLVPLADTLHRLFQADPSFGRPVPVIAENDVNALAVLTIHQIHYAVPDLVVVGVFDEGVGGGLVMDGRLRRGGSGRAMEIGHLTVGFPIGEDPYSPATGTGFKARCLCGQLGHVDTLAPPHRIVDEFGGGTLEQISQINARDPDFQRAQEAFKHGGAALGRALMHVSNTVNPSRIIMYLPAALADPEPDTAAAAYLGAVRQELTHAFAASDQPDYLRIRAFPANPHDVALLGAQAAAECVLESFIEHALRLDGCKTASKRSTTSSQGPAK
jgi:predicted NBD/HSP70 family sugar kinase